MGGALVRQAAAAALGDCGKLKRTLYPMSIKPGAHEQS